MLPIVSATLTAARAMNRLTIPELARMSGLSEDDVFTVENCLEDADVASVQLIAMALAVDLTKLEA